MENENITAIQLEALASILGSSDAYVFMLALSFVALIIACFMPKKAANKKSEDESQN
jgi:pyrroline-5-carboxylate reductase